MNRPGLAARVAAPFSITHRLRSFRYAVSGIAFTLRTQHNAWIHLAITLAVCMVGWGLRVNGNDWRWLILAILLVWFAELINTALEYVCDLVSPGYDERVKRVKDIAAGAVLMCAMGAAMIGALTFWPYV